MEDQPRNYQTDFEEGLEAYDMAHIKQLLEEEKFFIELRNENLFDNRPYEKTYHHTVDLIQKALNKEIREYERRFQKKFTPN